LFFQLDPIGNFAETGNWFKNFKTDTNLLQNSSKTVPNIICITADLYQNAGANIPQQLAYTLAHANEYLEILGTEYYKNIHFKFAVGSNYFFEIAKLKAFRVLWQTLLKGHAINNTRPAHIFATPSLRNKTIYDYNVNLLRTTTECMSAVLGTADTVANINYDAVYANNSDFAERISKNQLLTLKHEAHFNNAKQVADGSYYIDAITTQLAEKSLDIFKLIEKGGGFIKQLKEGVIQRKIKESHTLELQQFNSNSLHLLGTNLQLHKEDAMANNLQFNPFPKKKSHKTIIAPITRQRIAANMEAKRLKEEKNQI
jgi:Methylmalonyl-CoA mutase, N-terminal domain/subunit